MQMGLKDTIGNIFVPPPPPPPVTVVEGAENFRPVGVPPNAEYDEVQQAVKALKENMRATRSGSSKSTWPRTRSPSCDSGSASRAPSA